MTSGNSEAPDRATLCHGRIELALHQLQGGSGRTLLLLHGLGEATPRRVPAQVREWSGPVFGLDFTGHGASTLSAGGGYTAEALLGDADAAVEHLGEVTVVGRGVGAYIALMLIGARPESVRGVVLCDGPGLSGGGIQPGSPFVVCPQFGLGRAPDPFAMVELARDIRPPDYAVNFVRFAMERSQVPDPITVAAVVRPEWLAAVAREPGVVQRGVTTALAGYGRT